MDFKNKLQKAPPSPGIYIMKGSKEKTIYVGKAKNLRNRLRSYFQKSASLDNRKSKMVAEIRDFDYIVTENEIEALALEANFIKKFRPKFNIILRDDKNYPYLKLTVKEKWPKLEVVRKIEKDGSQYFGPYVVAGTMWEMLRFIQKHFPIRSCRYSMDKPFRPCVQFQMGRCLAPCDKSKRSNKHHDLYMKTVDEVRFFLLGEKKGLLSSLQQRMMKLSGELRYEEAAQVRDTLGTIERAWESQRVIAPELGDLDVIGLFKEDKEASVFMLFIRNGQVIGQKDFFLKKAGDIEERDLVSNFIEQFYSREILIPPRIVIPVRADLKLEKDWLSNKREKAVRLSYARGEHEKRVLDMANENALFAFSRHKDRKADKTLLAIKDLLKLKNIPKRIEAVDISNISGSEAAGGFVVWEDGEFIKKDYRVYKIKTVKGIDDFAMMEEVIERHLKIISEGKREMPRLILVDGGRGQLRSAINAMKGYDLPIEIAAMAKAKSLKSRKLPSFSIEQPDRVFLPGRRNSIPLEPFQPSTHLLQRIRDEVHRYAITFHKKLRAKRTLTSPLEDIKGIGKARRLLLLKHFGGIDAIRKASVEEIASLKGINVKTAELIKESLIKQAQKQNVRDQ
jgi:excinuclease ABC subunit C